MEIDKTHYTLLLHLIELFLILKQAPCSGNIPPLKHSHSLHILGLPIHNHLLIITAHSNFIPRRVSHLVNRIPRPLEQLI